MNRFLVGCAVSLSLACGGGEIENTLCSSGSKVDCACDGGVPGYGFCSRDGKSYGTCDCSVASASLQCQALETSHPFEGRTHVEACSAVQFATMPPSSGNHYPIWANFETYSEPVDPGFFVHSLEHGAVILFYNCPEGCPAEVAQAQALIDTFGGNGTDFLCANSSVRNRVMLMPYPALDVRFAAAAWTWTLRSQCFDPDVFRTFVNAHYARGPEITCSEGYGQSELRNFCSEKAKRAQPFDDNELAE